MCTCLVTTKSVHITFYWNSYGYVATFIVYMHRMDPSVLQTEGHSTPQHYELQVISYIYIYTYTLVKDQNTFNFLLNGAVIHATFYHSKHNLYQSSSLLLPPPLYNLCIYIACMVF